MDTSVDRARFNMVQQQVRPWDVSDDRVLAALAEIHREDFVPDAYRGLAYADIDIPLRDGQTMTSPKIAGRLLQALLVGGGDKVLEIGTGSGYLTACLSRLGGRVLSLEIDPETAASTRERLSALELGRLEVRDGDGVAGAAGDGPFDVIAVTGSVPTEATVMALQEQLAEDGRLFVVVGEAPVMEAILITRVGARDFRRESLFETELSALSNAAEAESFVF